MDDFDVAVKVLREAIANATGVFLDDAAVTLVIHKMTEAGAGIYLMLQADAAFYAEVPQGDFLN